MTLLRQHSSTGTGTSVVSKGQALAKAMAETQALMAHFSIRSRLLDYRNSFGTDEVSLSQIYEKLSKSLDSLEEGFTNTGIQLSERFANIRKGLECVRIIIDDPDSIPGLGEDQTKNYPKTEEGRLDFLMTCVHDFHESPVIRIMSFTFAQAGLRYAADELSNLESSLPPVESDLVPAKQQELKKACASLISGYLTWAQNRTAKTRSLSHKILDNTQPFNARKTPMVLGTELVSLKASLKALYKLVTGSDIGKIAIDEEKPTEVPSLADLREGFRKVIAIAKEIGESSVEVNSDLEEDIDHICEVFQGINYRSVMLIKDLAMDLKLSRFNRRNMRRELAEKTEFGISLAIKLEKLKGRTAQHVEFKLLGHEEQEVLLDALVEISSEASEDPMAIAVRSAGYMAKSLNTKEAFRKAFETRGASLVVARKYEKIIGFGITFSSEIPSYCQELYAAYPSIFKRGVYHYICVDSEHRGLDVYEDINQELFLLWAGEVDFLFGQVLIGPVANERALGGHIKQSALPIGDVRLLKRSINGEEETLAVQDTVHHVNPGLYSAFFICFWRCNKY